MLTAQYAGLASARLRGVDDSSSEFRGAWPLDRLADAYEIIAAMESDPTIRRAAAFVAGTAQQIRSQRQSLSSRNLPTIDRDQVDPAIAAAVLFLSAEQYADAYEAANGIQLELEQSLESEILGGTIKDWRKGG